MGRGRLTPTPELDLAPLADSVAPPPAINPAATQLDPATLYAAIHIPGTGSAIASMQGPANLALLWAAGIVR